MAEALTNSTARTKQDVAPRAAHLLAALEAEGITHVIGLPDNGTAALFELLANHQTISLVMVTREGEAFAIATGLWMGGKRPVVLIQNTGLLESGDSVRGTVVRMGVPVLVLVSYRGYAKLAAHGLDPRAVPPDPVALVRPDIDSTALVTESTLNAWGIPYETYASDDDVSRIASASERARREERPMALLLTRSLV